jgi:hypothetical protein
MKYITMTKKVIKHPVWGNLLADIMIIVIACSFLKLTCPYQTLSLNGIMNRILLSTCNGHEHVPFQTVNGHIVTGMVMGYLLLFFLVFLFRLVKGVTVRYKEV